MPGPNAAAFARVRSLISHNSLGAAAAILDSIRFHNAEWHYLYGIIYLRQGWYEKARECIQKAYEEEPGKTPSIATPIPRCTARAPHMQTKAAKRAARFATIAPRCSAATAAAARFVAAERQGA